MENRERDRVSQRTTPTEAGEINRKTSEEKGRENSGSGAEFGQSIGRSEHLSEGEGETMRNRNEDNVSDKDFGNEQSRRPTSDESGFGSSSGRSGSMGDSNSNNDRSDSSQEIDRGSGSRRGGSMGDSSEGQH
jgi:hypothetical protein